MVRSAWTSRHYSYFKPVCSTAVRDADRVSWLLSTAAQILQLLLAAPGLLRRSLGFLLVGGTPSLLTELFIYFMIQSLASRYSLPPR